MSESVETGARNRRKPQKVAELEESEAYNAMDVDGAVGTRERTNVGESRLMFPVTLNRDGMPRKKRGRPPKNQKLSLPGESNGGVSTPDTTDRVSTRRGWQSGPPKGNDGSRSQDHQQPSKLKFETRDSVRRLQQHPTMEYIRQEQERAQAFAREYETMTTSPIARSILQAHALGQPIPSGIILPLSDGIAKCPSAQGTALTAVLSVNTAHPNAVSHPHPRVHGKTRITTPTSTNQHPQQGTVAPHGDAMAGSVPQTTSPQTMALLSNYPIAAGEGVLTDPLTEMTGTTIGSIGIPTGETGKGRPAKAQQKSTEQSFSDLQKSIKPFPSRRKGNGILKRKGPWAALDALVTIQDDEPERLVNPLLDLPPPSVPQAPQQRRQSSVGAGGDPSSAGGQVEPPPKNIMPSSELQAWASIVFPRPDTYSIAQYARWLGFNVPAIDQVKDMDDKNYINADSTDIPFEMATDSTIHHIPPKGQFAEQVWMEAYRNCGNKDDDAVLEGCIDPMYKSFLLRSEEWTTSPSKANSKSPFKTPAYHQLIKFRGNAPSPELIGAVLQQSQGYGLLKAENWLVAPVTKSSGAPAAHSSGTTDHLSAGLGPTATATQIIGTSVLESNSDTNHAGAMPAEWMAGHASEISASAPNLQLSSEVPIPPRGSLSCGADASKPSSAGKDNNQMWGFAAWHKGRKTDEPDMSMVLHYQFLWYHLVSQSSMKEKVAELVMRIPHGPVPTVLGSLKVAIPPVTEQDYFANESASVSESRMAEITERQRLIVILYCVVLEHARKCDVCYCLLQVPPSLVPLLEKFFRMTQVPMRSRNIIGTSVDDNNSTFISMLCDLQKCSTKYALLLQRELRKESPTLAPQSKPTAVKHRLLVKLPTAMEVNSALVNPTSIQHSKPPSQNGTSDAQVDGCCKKRQRKDLSWGATNGSAIGKTMYREAFEGARETYVRLRANVDAEERSSVQIPDSNSIVEGVESNNSDETTPALEIAKRELAASIESQPAHHTGVRETQAKDVEIITSGSANEATAPKKSTVITFVGVPPTNSGQKSSDTPIVASVVASPKEESNNSNLSEATENRCVWKGTVDNLPSFAAQQAYLFDLEARSQDRMVANRVAVEEPAYSSSLNWEIVKSFPISATDVEAGASAAIGGLYKTAELTGQQTEIQRNGSDEVLQHLHRLQEELLEHERACLEPKVRSLLRQVVEERREFEKADFSKKIAEEQRILEKSDKVLARRKELDEAWQTQREMVRGGRRSPSTLRRFFVNANSLLLQHTLMDRIWMLFAKSVTMAK
jgi:hypothetical protein